MLHICSVKLRTIKCKLNAIELYANVKQFCDFSYETYFKNGTQFGAEKLAKQIRKTIGENEFHKTRHLSQLCPQTFRSMVRRIDCERNASNQCNQRNDHNNQYNNRYNKVITICSLYNQILNDTFRVPSMLTHNDMRHMLTCDDKYKIIRYLDKLYVKEFKEFQEWNRFNKIYEESNTPDMSRLNMKYDAMNAERIGIFNRCGQIVYGLWHNTLFTRIVQRHRNYLASKTNVRLAALYGQKLVIDLDYEQYIRSQDLIYVINLLKKVYYLNRRIPNGYNLSFCNLDNCANLSKLLLLHFKDKKSAHFDCDITSECYTQLYATTTTKLVYICPQADQSLLEYDHSVTYILCGVAHSKINPPLSMARNALNFDEKINLEQKLLISPSVIISDKNIKNYNFRYKTMFPREFHIKMKLREQGIEARRIPLENFQFQTNPELPEFYNILNNMRNGMGVCEAIKNGVPHNYFKTEQQLEIEDNEAMKVMLEKRNAKFRINHSFDNV